MIILEEKVKTPAKQAFVDITPIIEKAIQQAKITNGHILVWIPHTTAAITVNENADPSVVGDIISRLERAFPTNDSKDTHAEGNSHAHLKASILGCSQYFIVKNGRLLLGTWQGVFLCEFDGPRTRSVIISLVNKD